MTKFKLLALLLPGLFLISNAAEARHNHYSGYNTGLMSSGLLNSGLMGTGYTGRHHRHHRHW